MQRIKRRANKLPATVATGSSSKSVNNNEISSNLNTTAAMRKPLSDLTNSSNLIPIHTLRKLISPTPLPHSQTTQSSLLPKSHSSVFPISQKPLILGGPQQSHDNPKSDTRSGTNVSSSNSGILPKSNPQNPSPCSKNPADHDHSELVIYSRRRGQKKQDTLPKTSTSVQKKKIAGNATSDLLGSTPAEKEKDKGEAIVVPFDAIAAEKANDQWNSVAVPVDSTPAGDVRGKQKQVSASLRPSYFEKTRDKGKDIYVPSGCNPVQKMWDKGKAIVVPINCTLEEVEEKGRSTDVLINSSQKKQNEKIPADAMVQSCPPLLRTGRTRNGGIQAGEDTVSKARTDPRGRSKKRKCSEEQPASKDMFPPEFVEKMQTYFAEVDAFELPVEEVSENDLD